MMMKYTSKEESILHYLRKIVLHGKGKVTMRGSIILQRTRREGTDGGAETGGADTDGEDTGGEGIGADASTEKKKQKK